jgi:hypothetical protein
MNAARRLTRPMMTITPATGLGGRVAIMPNAIQYADGTNADLTVAGTRPPAIATRASGGPGGRVLRTGNACVLLCGTEN